MSAASNEATLDEQHEQFFTLYEQMQACLTGEELAQLSEHWVVFPETDAGRFLSLHICQDALASGRAEVYAINDQMLTGSADASLEFLVAEAASSESLEDYEDAKRIIMDAVMRGLAAGLEKTQATLASVDTQQLPTEDHQ